MNKQEYLEIASRRKGTDSPVIDLTMPSGAIWRVVPISLMSYIVSGRLPLHLISGLRSIKNLETKEAQIDLASKMTAADIINTFSIVRDVMINNVLEPKISLEPGEDTLLPEQILPEDFEYFFKFVFSGGQAPLNSFRQPTNGDGGEGAGPTAAAGPDVAGDAPSPVPNTFS